MTSVSAILLKVDGVGMLQGNCSFIVLTLPAAQAVRLQALEPQALARDIVAWFGGELGAMQLQDERYAYPLVAKYARRFTAQRSERVGDAAVGMHPVTAHGFNLGLRSQATLVARIIKAARAGQDIGSTALLADYGLEHRRDTVPLYTATNAIGWLYTANRPLALVARRIALHLSDRIPPCKQALLARLTQGGRS